MVQTSKILMAYGNYLGIFLLMLSTFLIGYFAGLWLQKFKDRSLIERLKKEVNFAKLDANARDIETIFTEIKPQIIQVVKDTQQEILEKATTHKKDIIEKARTSYVTYSRKKPVLNFDSFGHGNAATKDNLTSIQGIGPYIEEKLNEIGIYNFDQISKFSYQDIQILTELIDFFPGRIEKDDWVSQAKEFKKKNKHITKRIFREVKHS